MLIKSIHYFCDWGRRYSQVRFPAIHLCMGLLSLRRQCSNVERRNPPVPLNHEIHESTSYSLRCWFINSTSPFLHFLKSWVWVSMRQQPSSPSENIFSPIMSRSTLPHIPILQLIAALWQWSMSVCTNKIHLYCCSGLFWFYSWVLTLKFLLRKNH